jgi:hypothetical protein
MRSAIMSPSGVEKYPDGKSSNFCVFCQVTRAAGSKYLPLGHDIRPICYTQSFAHIMISNQDTYILILQPGNHRLDVFYRNGIYTRKGFIQQHEFRVYGQCTRNFSTSPFASAKRIAIVFAHMMKPEFIQQRFEFVFLIFLGHIGHLEDRFDIVFYRKLAEN